MSKPLIEEVLQSIIDPYLGVDLLTAKVLRQVDINDDNISLQLVFGYPIEQQRATILQKITQAITTKLPNGRLNVTISSEIISHAVQAGVPSISGVKNIIAVASGKGGVGKSTTAVNLALALQYEGATVGILDADIYGPNQPHMLGAKRKPVTEDGKTFQPIISHGLQSMSIGYLVDNDTAMIWRGPMATGALQQLLNNTAWQNLDYLVIDLPPGTGDIQLTMAQKIPVTGAIVITTPQTVALLDVRKAIRMFEKVKVHVLGIVENMSLHICSQCGHQEAIFGQGGAEHLAQEFMLPLLGSLPLDSSIGEMIERGTPTVAVNPNSDIALIYREIARKISARLSLQPKNYAKKFPQIVVQHDK